MILGQNDVAVFLGCHDKMQQTECPQEQRESLLTVLERDR